MRWQRHPTQVTRIRKQICLMARLAQIGEEEEMILKKPTDADLPNAAFGEFARAIVNALENLKQGMASNEAGSLA